VEELLENVEVSGFNLSAIDFVEDGHEHERIENVLFVLCGALFWCLKLDACRVVNLVSEVQEHCWAKADYSDHHEQIPARDANNLSPNGSRH